VFSSLSIEYMLRAGSGYKHNFMTACGKSHMLKARRTNSVQEFEDKTSHNVLDLFKSQPKRAKIDDCNELPSAQHLEVVLSLNLLKLKPEMK